MIAPERPELAVREALIAGILSFLGDQRYLSLDDLRSVLETEIDAAGPAALLALKTRLGADHGWDYCPGDPLVRRIHHRLADRFLDRDSTLTGGEHLPQLDGCAVTVVSNHLSYADANVIEVLLHRAGATALAGRLTALAGPKVFTNRTRRFSSLCFGTVKVPQNAGVASGEAVLHAREAARAARQSIEVALGRLDAGDALILFGEGTRSRTGAMQPMLPGIARYFERPGTRVLPAGLTGTEMLFPVQGALRAARVALYCGAPIEASRLLESAGGDRRLVVDAIGLAVAALVPAPYKGAYSDPDAHADARSVLGRATRERR